MNPSREGSRFESIFDLFDTLAADSRLLPTRSESELLGDHLRVVGQACARARPALRLRIEEWLEAVRIQRLPLSPSGLEALGHIAMTSSLIGKLGADWWVADAGRGWEL